jgi:hypothetical protein
MDKMLQRLVDQAVMPESFGEHIEKALENKDSFIISGHKGWGILPLMAGVSAAAKAKHSIKQIKKPEDLEDQADYYIIGDLKIEDFEKLVVDSISKPNSATITIKDPEHAYSIMKVLKSFFKATNDSSKTFQVLECAKINDEKKLVKITTMSFDENGKLSKEDINA